MYKYYFLLFNFTIIISLSACNGEDEAKRLKLEQLQTKWSWEGKTWQAQELLTLDDGEQLYIEHCVKCHSSDGMGNIGRRAPALRGNPLVNDSPDISIKVTLFGKRKMQPYYDKLSNKDIAAIISYIRNSWNNNSGSIITKNQIEIFQHFDLGKLQEKWNWEGKQWQEHELRFLEFGETNYEINCAGCHLKNGGGQIQIGAPALKGNTLLKGNPDAYISTVLLGIKVMPSFEKILSNEIIASILSYEQNAWGLKSGKIVQPEQVNKIRLSIQK